MLLQEVPWDGLKWIGGTLVAILTAIGTIAGTVFAAGKIRELRTNRSYTVQDELNELHKTNDGVKRQAEVDLVSRLLTTVKEVNTKYDVIHEQLMKLSTTHAKLEAAGEYKDLRIEHLEKENETLRGRIRQLEEQVAVLIANQKTEITGAISIVDLQARIEE